MVAEGSVDSGYSGELRESFRLLKMDKRQLRKQLPSPKRRSKGHTNQRKKLHASRRSAAGALLALEAVGMKVEGDGREVGLARSPIQAYSNGRHEIEEPSTSISFLDFADEVTGLRIAEVDPSPGGAQVGETSEEVDEQQIE